MTNSQSVLNGLQVNSRSMLVGGSLIVAGGLIAVAGVTISGSALIIAIRRWVNEMDEPPTDLARRKWAQAKAAGAAGASAWQNGPSPQRQGARA